MTSTLTRNWRFFLRDPWRAWDVSAACRRWTQEHPRCAWCGKRGGVQAHHIVPLSVDPSPENALNSDGNRLVSLCGRRGCHRIVGHFGDWRLYNPMLSIVTLTFGRRQDEHAH